RVQRTRLQRLEGIAGSHVGYRSTHLAPDLPANAGRAEAKPLEIFKAVQLIAEPAARLSSGIAGEERLHAKLVVHLVPDRLAAKVAHPGCQFTGGHAERNTREEGKSCALVLPV